jgi:type I restriction enzyme S subunit
MFYLLQTLNLDCEQHKRYWISKFAPFQIPLPPLPIQKRIAEILDAADALKRKDQELLKKYDELAQAIFIDMFGDPVKNEKGYNLIRLGDCLENIQIGPFGTQLHESDYIKNGIPIINPMHIGDLKIKPNYNYSISEEKYLELPQYHLKENDIILGRRGEMGRCAIVTKEQGKCLCGTGSLYLTVNIEFLDPLFLVYVLSRKSTKIALENVSAGTTMANLNKSIIGDFKIILPNIQMQRDFVRAVKLSEDSIEFTIGLVSKSNSLFQTLIQKAFKGELVAENY